MKIIAKETSITKSQLAQRFMDIVNGRDYIRIYPGAKLLLDRYNEENNKSANVAKNYWNNIGKWNCWNTFFDMVFALGFLLIAVLFVKRGWCSIGEVAAIYTLYGTFSYNFLELGRYIPELINCIVRAQIVFDYMEEREEQVQGDLEFSPGKIELRDVSFGYDEKEVINNLSVEFEENKTIAIIGQTGCGKSTLIKLLMRIYPVPEKRIYIGGKNLSGGERQRIALARAFVKNAPILLMDEATSALDNNNETEIQAAIKKLINGKTALIVAHRDITIDFCDEKYQVL